MAPQFFALLSFPEKKIILLHSQKCMKLDFFSSSSFYKSGKINFVVDIKSRVGLYIMHIIVVTSYIVFCTFSITTLLFVHTTFR